MGIEECDEIDGDVPDDGVIPACLGNLHGGRVQSGWLDRALGEGCAPTRELSLRMNLVSWNNP